MIALTCMLSPDSRGGIHNFEVSTNVLYPLILSACESRR